LVVCHQAARRQGPLRILWQRFSSDWVPPMTTRFGLRRSSILSRRAAWSSFKIQQHTKTKDAMPSFWLRNTKLDQPQVHRPLLGVVQPHRRRFFAGGKVSVPGP
jgi:hypothetical protein